MPYTCATLRTVSDLDEVPLQSGEFLGSVFELELEHEHELEQCVTE